jgi:pimeloyl-ACP methyl ester carboxylesterase
MQERWAELIALIRTEMEQGTDPADPKVQTLARRWQELLHQATGGDPGIQQAMKRHWEEQGDALAAQFGSKYDSRPIWGYLETAILHTVGATALNSFVSFDGTRIAYSDEGKGPAVILLHGFGTDGLTQFGDFGRLRGQLITLRALFREHMGFEPPLPEPPAEGRPGLVPRLRAAGARVIVPDLRGFGASDKPRDPAAYAHSAMARDVLALIEHLGLDGAHVLGFSMGALTAAELLVLGNARVKSAILSGIGQYILEGEEMVLPKGIPMAEHLPRPLTLPALAEARAKVLDRGEIIPGDMSTFGVIAARATGADLAVLAAAERGATGLVPIEPLHNAAAPVLVLNGAADVGNQSVGRFLEVLPNARTGTCDGDHHTTPWQPSFQEAVVNFFTEQWRARGAAFEGQAVRSAEGGRSA